MSKARLWLFVGILACSPALGGAGCDKSDPVLGESGQDTADDQSAATDDTSAEAVLIQALSSANPANLADENEAANQAAIGVFDELGMNCVVGVPAGNVVTYTLTDCTGPYGYLKVSGNVVATYTLTDDFALAVDYKATGLQINNGVGDWNASVVRTQSGTTRTLNVTTDWKGYTADNKATSREGSYVATIDAAAKCLGLAGSWTTRIGLVAWDTDVADLNVCQGECPADGGVVTWSAGVRQTTLSYDGSDVASWSNEKGNSGTVNLACGL